MLIRFHTTVVSVAVGVTAAASAAIQYSEFAAGMIFVPAGSSITSLKWYSSTQTDGTFLPAYDADGAAMTQAVAAGRCYPVPADLAGCIVIKAVGDAAGTIAISLKA